MCRCAPTVFHVSRVGVMPGRSLGERPKQRFMIWKELTLPRECIFSRNIYPKSFPISAANGFEPNRRFFVDR
jgi:hypothetical protein